MTAFTLKKDALIHDRWSSPSCSPPPSHLTPYRIGALKGEEAKKCLDWAGKKEEGSSQCAGWVVVSLSSWVTCSFWRAQDVLRRRFGTLDFLLPGCFFRFHSCTLEQSCITVRTSFYLFLLVRLCWPYNSKLSKFVKEEERERHRKWGQWVCVDCFLPSETGLDCAWQLLNRGRIKPFLFNQTVACIRDRRSCKKLDRWDTYQ